MTDKDFGFGTSDPHRSGGVQCSYLQHHDGDHFFHAWLYNESCEVLEEPPFRIAGGAGTYRPPMEPPSDVFPCKQRYDHHHYRRAPPKEEAVRCEKRKFFHNWWESTDPWTLPCTLVFSALFSVPYKRRQDTMWKTRLKLDNKVRHNHLVQKFRSIC